MPLLDFTFSPPPSLVKCMSHASKGRGVSVHWVVMGRYRSSLTPPTFPLPLSFVEFSKAVGILFGKMGRGQVEQETLTKVGQLVESLQVNRLLAKQLVLLLLLLV